MERSGEGVYLDAVRAGWVAQYVYYMRHHYRGACQSAIDGKALSERQACDLRESVAFDDGIAVGQTGQAFHWQSAVVGSVAGAAVAAVVTTILYSIIDR